MLISVILCNGNSSRMGRDKATIVLANGFRMVDIIFKELQKLSQECYISGSIDGYNKQILIPDLEQGIGPVGGIFSALKRFPNAKVLFVPVDMPKLTKEVLLPLTLLDGYDASFYQDKPLPLCIQSTPDILNIIRCNIVQKVFSIKILIATLKVKTINFGDDNIKANFTNLNTPFELEEYERSLQT